MVFGMSLLVPVAALLFAAPAGRVAIVDVGAPETMTALAGQVTRAVLAEAERAQLVFDAPEVLRKKVAPKQYAELRKCGGNPACVAQALDGQGYTAAVVGQLERDDRNYLLKLYFIDLQGLKVIADVDRAILIAARRFQKDLDEAVPRMLRGEREARGTVTIESNLPDAQVSLNGEFVGTPPVKLTLKPGKYEVKLERKKYLPVTRLIGVEANADATERIPLLLIPGEIADPLPGVGAGKQAPAGDRPGARIGVATWIFGALTVATAAVGLAFGIIAHGQDQKLLDGYNATTFTYAGTRADAQGAAQNALLANVFYGAAGACLVATVIFGIVDGLSQPAVQVAPSVTSSGAGLTFGGRF
jgi:hypothetical protein